MNERDPFETELQRFQPAKPPEEFLARLAEALPDLRDAAPPLKAPPEKPVWLSLLRWLAPAMALSALAVTLTWRLGGPTTKNQAPAVGPPVTAALKADHVEIDQHLVAAFDAVAHLPDGEPIRFRCRKWADEVVLQDSARGLTVERRSPRLEVIPIGYETY